MDEDDPEKRIAELERRLAEAKWAGGEHSAGQVNAGQQAGFPPPPVDWQQPSDWQQPWQKPSPFGIAQSGPRVGSFRPPRWIIAVSVAAVLIPLVFVVIALFAAHRVTNSISPSPSGTGPTQLQTAEGLNGLLTQIRNRFGDTMGYRLVVYPDYAILYRADPQNNRKEKSYYYRRGNWSDWGKSSSPSSFDQLADLSNFDVAAVTAKMPGAAQSLNITDAASTYLIVEGAAGGSLKLSIYVSDGDSGYMEINADGSIKQLHPPS
jgi:hypothetical protein